MSLAVQLLVLELSNALLACLLVQLAVCLLAVNAAVFDEVAGIAALELDGAAVSLAAVCTDFIILSRHAVHHGSTILREDVAGLERKSERVQSGSVEIFWVATAGSQRRRTCLVAASYR